MIAAPCALRPQTAALQRTGDSVLCSCENTVAKRALTRVLQAFRASAARLAP